MPFQPIARIKHAISAFLGNLRMSLKVSAAPTLVTIFMLGISVVAICQAVLQKAALERLVGVVLAKDHEAADIGLETMKTHATVYRFLSVLSNSASSDTTSLSLGKIRSSIDGIAKSIERLARYPLTEVESSTISAIAGDFDRYAKAVNYVLEMTGTDVALALTFTSDADTAYSALTLHLEELRSLERSATSATVASTTEAAANSIVTVAALLAAALAATSLLILLVSRAISTPILKLTDVMTRLAAGDQQIVVPGPERQDEIGAMSRAVEIFKQTAVAATKLSTERELQRATERARSSSLERLASRFEKQVADMLRAVADAASQMEVAAGGLTSSSETAALQVSTAKDASARASATTNAVAAAAEQLASSINEIRSQVTESSRVASNAVMKTQSAITIVRELSEAAGQIDAVVDLISDVAKKTNLLALNAAIEAARAGDVGSGFSVVANEVKVLAGQTGLATQNIRAQISGIQAMTAQTVDAMVNIEKAIGAMGEATTVIDTTVLQQATATDEISRHVSEAASHAESASVNMVMVGDATRIANDAAAEVLKAAHALTAQSNELSSEVDGFLSSIKVA